MPNLRLRGATLPATLLFFCMKTILVATDFSAEATYALHVARQLAQHTGAALTLLHVVEPPGATAPITAEALVAAREQLAGLRLSTLAAEPGMSVRTVIETGNADDCIRAVAATQGADLVVVGTQNHGVVKRLVLGTHTERLVRLASRPVLAVKHPAPHFNVRRLIFPSDFSPEAENAAAGLHRVLALFPDAALHLLHIVAPAARRGDIQERISSFIQRHGLARATPAVVEAPSRAVGIRRFAESTAADLVLLATHGRTGFSRLLQASVAEEVAAKALPPVLTFHFEQP